jgi:Response regulator receiver domain
MIDVLMPPPNLPGRIVRVLLVDDDTELGELIREYLAREGFLLAASRVPVLMLTARGDDVDRIVGLELGADDYLSKPFNPRELVARIRAILRRASYDAAPDSAEPVEERLGIDDVEVDACWRSFARRPDGRPPRGAGAGRARARADALRPKPRRSREPAAQEARAAHRWRRAPPRAEGGGLRLRAPGDS